MAQLNCHRWQRYGKDRLYVDRPDGERVGWVDLVTGARTLTDPTHENGFSAAINSWYVETASVERTVGTRRAIGVEPSVSNDGNADAVYPAEEKIEPSLPEQRCPSPNPWHDLNLHVPGQAARDQATKALTAMRETSRVGTLVARAFDMKTDERAWRVGAAGEESVGGRLDKLAKDGWHVLHSVPVGSRGSDIDHVLVGPGGVFTINTKNHPGKNVWVASRSIRVNGQPVPYLRNSRFEGDRAERVLTAALGFAVLVRPVLIILTGSVMPTVKIKQQPPDVTVLDRMQVPGAFRRASQKLSLDQVDAIFDLARRCTTWTGLQSCSCAARPD